MSGLQKVGSGFQNGGPCFLNGEMFPRPGFLIGGRLFLSAYDKCEIRGDNDVNGVGRTQNNVLVKNSTDF